MKDKEKLKLERPTIYIIECLYSEMDAKWIDELESNVIEPFMIQKYLVMDDRLRVQARWLDKYSFSLPPKMFLSLAWTVVPKEGRGFIKYIKKKTEEEKYWFILEKVRKHFILADNDYEAIRGRLIEAIKKDLVGWFTFYGIKKRYWKEFFVNFDLIKEVGDKIPPKPKGLDAWGM